MDNRTQIYKRITVYGFHNQPVRVVEHVAQYKISSDDAMEAFQKGRAMARRGDKCHCSRCAA